MDEKSTIQKMEDEISKKQNQKTQNINVRISPATKADIITKAANLDLTISEYVEYILTNEESNKLRVLGEKRKGEELKETYENKLTELKEEFKALESEKQSIDSRASKLSNVLLINRLSNAENDLNMLQLLNYMKESIINSEEIKERLDFFTENQKIRDILSAFSGEEFVYYNNGKKEAFVPETIEDIFSIMVSDFHSKLGLFERESESIETKIIED